MTLVKADRSVAWVNRKRSTSLGSYTISALRGAVPVSNSGARRNERCDVEIMSALWRPPGAAANDPCPDGGMRNDIPDTKSWASKGPILPRVSMLVAPLRGALAGYRDVEFVPSEKGAR